MARTERHNAEEHNRSIVTDEPNKQRQQPPATPSIAIIGASYAGLALANCLLSHRKMRVVVLEKMRRPSPGTIFGTVRVPSAKTVLARLGLEWKFDDDDPSVVPEERLLFVLRKEVEGMIRYRHKVESVTETDEGRQSLRIRDGTSGASYALGPFDVVVAANGVLSPFRSCPPSVRLALAGDARWARDRWYDFGFERIRRGADVALRDGMELGELLTSHYSMSDGRSMGRNTELDLGKFGARNQNRDWFRRRVAAAASAALVVLLAVFVWPELMLLSQRL